MYHVCELSPSKSAENLNILESAQKRATSKHKLTLVWQRYLHTIFGSSSTVHWLSEHFLFPLNQKKNYSLLKSWICILISNHHSHYRYKIWKLVFHEISGSCRRNGSKIHIARGDDFGGNLDHSRGVPRADISAVVNWAVLALGSIV